MAHLQQDAHAVSDASAGVLARAVLEFFHDGQCVGHRLIACLAVDICHGADTAGIMFDRMIFVLFHLNCSFVDTTENAFPESRKAL